MINIPFILISFANFFPLILGIVFYQKYFDKFQSNYVLFTILFWLIGILLIFFYSKNKLSKIKELLELNLQYIKILNFFIFFSFFMFFINYELVLTSREIGLNVTNLKFKLFFLFEDIYIVTFYVLLFKTFKEKNLFNIMCLIIFTFFIVALFGRFIILSSLFIFILLVWADNTKNFKSSLISIFLLIILVIFGLGIIENIRNPNSLFLIQLLDRISEVATLSVADSIMSIQNFEYFQNFENLLYIYIPSVFFPDKPFISDGFNYMIENFNIGGGPAGTRFPLMLHLDSFRRFGWFGLTFAIIPVLVLHIFIRLNILINKLFIAPFAFILSFKYLFFLYPRTILGILEIIFYTYLRSIIIIILIFYLIKFFFYKKEFY